MPHKRTSFALDTTVDIAYYDEAKKDAVNGAIRLISDYEKVFSRTDPGSELWQVNHAEAGAETQISRDLYMVLNQASLIYGLTDGAFDITLGGVSALYDFSGKQNVPSQEELKEALSHTGMEKIALITDASDLLNFSDGTYFAVAKEDPELVIDLGAIAKGYIADRAKEYLLEKGVTSAVINLGGNILTVGEKPMTDGSFQTFNVGIQKPEKGSSVVVKTVSLSDTSLVTSGTYERSFTRDGVFYHHILDAVTGCPFNPLSSYGLDVVSVSVSGPESMICDALSTACFLLGPERAKQAVSAFPGYTAYILSSNEKIVEIGPF